MKKETVNTFDKGLVKDLHPLTTPNNVLTDALNATLITYNGNEMVLQNDMGNTKVGTAFLPAGYVPVGMKEHGGIVYVAAYNPETKKGQIGSYPSPKQLWEGEDWSVNTEGAVIDNISLNTGQFYGLENGELNPQGSFIVNETVKLLLFKFTDGTVREFHPGDKYAISIPDVSVYNTIKDYVDSGKLEIKLGVIKKDGSIEIMADASEDWFLFSGEASTYIQNNTPRVFNASSSGSLILIVNIVTLDSFNLLREYDLANDNETVNVTFTGKGTRGQQIFLSTSGTPMTLYGGAQGMPSQGQQQIVLSGTTESKTFVIYPQLDYGIVRRMKRSGTINFDRIKKSQGDFHEWRFFVTENYIKIGWAYEFYNLGNKKVLDGIQMSFYDVVKPSTYPNSPEVSITFQKDSYSGNFEDYIRFDQHPQIHPNKVYIVRISRLVRGSGAETITHKMLYCSPYYNEYYNQVYTNSQTGEEIDVNFSNCVQFQNPRQESIDIVFDQNISYNQDDITRATLSKVPTNGDQATIIKENVDVIALGSQDYTTSTTIAKAHDFEYVTKLTNVYNVTQNLTAEYQYTNKYLIGTPNPAYLNQVLNSVTINNQVDSNPIWRNLASISYYNNIGQNEYSITMGNPQEAQDGKRTINFTLTDCRYIQGANSALISEPYTVVDYVPVYDPNALDKYNTFYSYLSESPQVLSGEKGEQIRYASTLVNGDVVDGADGGGGDDDDGLYAANRAINSLRPPTVNMFAGTGGQKGSLRFVSPYAGDTFGNADPFRRRSINGWDHDDEYREVDGSDNYLIAVWKCTDGNAHFVNLITQKQWPVDATEEWPRLDVMLKCFMSQIFIAQKTTKKNSYVTTDSHYYRYQEGNTILTIKLTNSGITSNNDVMLPYEGAESIAEVTTLLDYYTKVWAPKRLEGLVNLIPAVSASGTVSFDLDPIEIEGEFSINNIIRFYQGAKLEVEQPDIDVTKIMILDRSKQAYNISCSGSSSGNKLTPRRDGAFVWKEQPALVEATPRSDNLDPRVDSSDVLYDWRGEAWNMHVNLYRMFKTRAELLGINDLAGNDEYNELLGNHEEMMNSQYPHFHQNFNGDVAFKGRGMVYGRWVQNTGFLGTSGDSDAPDMYFFILASNKSLYRIFTNQPGQYD